jgi:hypothetical protein
VARDNLVAEATGPAGSNVVVEHPGDRLGRRRLYVTVSQDSIHEQPFWSRYVEHVDLRHRVAHRGYTTTREDAAKSVAVAKEFVEHVKATFPSGPEQQL